MQNVITVQHNNATLTIKVAKKQLPFSNNFTQNKAQIKQREGVDEVHALVTCTANSREPGRMYATAYTLRGEMLFCVTYN